MTSASGRPTGDGEAACGRAAAPCRSVFSPAWTRCPAAIGTSPSRSRARIARPGGRRTRSWRGYRQRLMASAPPEQRLARLHARRVAAYRRAGGQHPRHLRRLHRAHHSAHARRNRNLEVVHETLESFYAELRRCRTRCGGRPFVEHRGDGTHDCAPAGCSSHVCRPMAASTVRQIHAVISGALSAAVRWGWIATNPARGAQRPRQRPPQPDPPSPSEAARLVDGAFAADEDWGTLVWLVMTTGMRRGEVCALRWARVDLETGIVDVRRSYRLRYGVGTEKDTKTHQMRRIALDNESVVLLTEHKRRCSQRLRDLGMRADRRHVRLCRCAEVRADQPVFAALSVQPVSQPGPAAGHRHPHPRTAALLGDRASDGRR